MEWCGEEKHRGACFIAPEQQRLFILLTGSDFPDEIVSDRLLTVQRIFCWQMHVGIISKPRRTFQNSVTGLENENPQMDLSRVMSLWRRRPWDVFPIQTQSGRKWKSAQPGLFIHSFLLFCDQEPAHRHLSPPPPRVSVFVCFGPVCRLRIVFYFYILTLFCGSEDEPDQH